MIEALVSFRMPKDGDVQKNGDIIVVKLPGAPWGGEEQKYHIVVQHDDQALEARLLEMQSNGKENPFIIYPYAVYDTKTITRRGKKIDMPIMAQQSSVCIDVGLLPEEIKAAVLDPEISVPILDINVAAGAKVDREAPVLEKPFDPAPIEG